MRTIIAGSRGLGYEEVEQAMEICGWKPTVVISGAAVGVDQAGERWARSQSIPVECYPANWNQYGKRAGYVRNKEMAEKAEALVAIWDGQSRGSRHMIDTATKRGLRIFVWRCK